MGKIYLPCRPMAATPWHLYLMAVLYFSAGMLHFIYPRVYMRIIPPYLPHRKILVYASGAAEVMLAAGLCFRESRTVAIYGLIVMLLVYLPIHFYMLSGDAGMKLPRWVLILRVPFQFILIYWAYSYT